MPNTLITIGGPTGIGKTSWAIRLARHYRTEILSADSRQFYREMPIGTAAPTAEERAAAPHHFIGHRSVREPYSVGAYRMDALERLRELFKTYDLLILVGGSGLYMDAVTQGLDAFPEVREGVREGLNDLLARDGVEALQDLLREKDPEYFETVDRQNPHRLIRALEVCLSGDAPYSSFLGRREAPDFFRTLPLGITAPREVVYRRIDKRVGDMMAAGLEAEARALYPMRHLSALQTVGYQELFAYFEGKWDLDTAVREIAKNTRRFAKRQGTWLRRNPELHWFSYDASEAEVIAYIDSRIKTDSHG